MTDNLNLYDLDREQRGLLLAQEGGIKQQKDGWRVPSQTGAGAYKVTIEGEKETCTCPDHENRECKCKHIYAVEYTVTKTVDEEGNVTITEEVTKKTYSQDWSSYNEAQTNEHRLFMELLADLVETVDEPEQEGPGRPSKPLKDMVYASALKVYSGFSLRRFESMMDIAEERDHMSKTCTYATVSNYMNKEDMENILHELIALSSSPLSTVETDFAVDSSGFSTSRFDRYFSFKHGHEEKYRKWIKAHLCTGVKTNIVTSAVLTEGKAGDSPRFEPLVKRTAEVFNIEEVSADGAYSSRDNHDLVYDLGGEAYIPFDSRATGRAKGSPAWKKMYHKFQMENEEFAEHYHKRSNVETTFHMVKTKFGDSVNAKNEQAQLNEVLLKLLCHNIVVLIHEMQELGINPEF